ncbi:MAG: ribE [Gammaproteobacteria bacterium]|jgi:riboflavin synthase|nr:ribE [Gammaproteobacteria bacterium]
MFTGIVETTGKITSLDSQNDCKTFCITPKVKFNDLLVGESIAVNGVCLTVEKFSDQSFYVTLVPETLRLTNLSQLQLNSEVNLERAMLASSRIGGHFMQGHVDQVGEIVSIEKDGAAALLIKISIPKHLAKYIIKKGFIGLDGMSITLVDVSDTWFSVTFIPHTISETIVKNYHVGTRINLEVDMFAKYIEKLLETRHEQ